jgi:diguanylate cyclase (GGDEF)-like protein/PAS domain S-box-containing protein
MKLKWPAGAGIVAAYLLSGTLAFTLVDRIVARLAPGFDQGVLHSAAFLLLSALLLLGVLRSKARAQKGLLAEISAERERYRAILNHVGDAVVLLDARGRPVDANDRALQSYGYDSDNFRNADLATLSAGEQPWSQIEARQWLRKALAGEEPCFDWHAQARDGTLFWVEVRLRRVLLAGVPHLLASLRDINQRRRNEQWLRQSEQRFRGLFENTPMVAVHGYDRHRRAIYWNRASEELYGFEAGMAVGQSIEALMTPPSDRATTIARIDRWLAGGPAPPTGEMERIDRQGNKVRVHSSQVLLHDDAGNPEIYFVDVDLGQLSRAMDALRAREAAMQLAAQSALELLRNARVDEVIPHVLARVGEGLEVDRAYLFEVQSASSCSMRFEWVHEGISAELDNPEMQDLPMEELLPHWLPEWRAGRSVSSDTADLLEPERGIMESQSIQSILIVPVLFNDAFWGFLGFDAVRGRRAWSATEDSVLRIIGAALAAAIERERAEEKLRQGAKVFESTRDGVMITDLQGNIVSVNAAFCAISGYDVEEVLGRNPRLLKSGRADSAFFADVWRQIESQGHWQGEVWNRRKSGEEYPQWLSITTVRDDRGKPTHYVGVGTDISELKRSEEQLQHLAHHDPLTGLPNRLMAQARLEHALQRAQRRNSRIAVLFLDLDGFKHINDSLGHSVGDGMLTTIAQRLKGRLRDEDALARLGGDEFLLLAENIQTPADAANIARKLLESLQQPLDLGGRQLFVTASIGISLYPDDGRSWSELIRNADTAMYQAKAAGRDQFCFYTADMNANALAQLELEVSLRQAQAQSRFELHYQPKIDLGHGHTVGFEALLRMHDTHGKLLLPGTFIPMAERSGLIIPIGAWVIEAACRQARRWHDAGHTHLTVAVNVSACQFHHPDFADHVRLALQHSGLPGSALELELTESVLMTDPDTAVDRLLALKRSGVRLALDDFGTGYSSLGYLLRLPIDALKIDRSFVAGLGHDVHAIDIVNSIIGLARRMKLRVVAEGVETTAQASSLRAYGCDEMQGYLLSRPMAAAATEEWLLERTAAAWVDAE